MTGKRPTFRRIRQKEHNTVHPQPTKRRLVFFYFSPTTQTALLDERQVGHQKPAASHVATANSVKILQPDTNDTHLFVCAENAHWGKLFSPLFWQCVHPTINTSETSWIGYQQQYQPWRHPPTSRSIRPFSSWLLKCTADSRVSGQQRLNRQARGHPYRSPLAGECVALPSATGGRETPRPEGIMQ